MAYEYLVSGSPTYFKTRKEDWVTGYQTFIDESFYNSSTIETISRESPFASGSFVSVDVRVTSSIDNLTGMKMSDDYKTLIFSNITGSAIMGEKFLFDDNYYLVTNTDNIKSEVSKVTVRRCNNVLRWADINGNNLSEHCVIDYKIATPDNISRTDPLMPDGTIKVFCQGNANTRTITENQRFLFGNSSHWNCYRVHGGGVNNFLNAYTSDNTSARLLEFALGKHYVNVNSDDIVNGIADTNKNVLLLTISPSAIAGGVGDTYQLYDVTTLNGTAVSKAVTYTTSASSIATISGSIVTLSGSGTCVITGSLVDNSAITDTVDIMVSSGSLAENDIRVTPIPSYILQGDTETYTVYVYNDGVVAGDAFTFALADANVPVANYTFTVIDDNSFSIKNNKLYLEYPLLINAVSGSLQKQISITLKGSY